MKPTNLDVKRGDTFWLEATYRYAKSKAPIDLTGASLYGQVAVTENGVVEVIEMECEILPGTEGQFTLKIDEEITTTMPIGKWPYFVRVTYADGIVKTWFQGQFVVYD